ncbi:MAG: hypothetical protein LJE70_00160 [Chromatiaceae bacterium]|nr:hypothetical protein [Chromatiaceae bacterium]
MTKYTISTLAVAAVALTPLAASAFADREEVENYCQQEAMKEGVAADKLAGYMANCVATNMKAEKEIEDEGEGEKKE